MKSGLHFAASGCRIRANHTYVTVSYGGATFKETAAKLVRSSRQRVRRRHSQRRVAQRSAGILAQLRLAARDMERAFGYDTRRLVCAYLHNRNIYLHRL
jgi:hypothetical protein